MPEVQGLVGGDYLQGWGNVVVALVGLHLLALAFWVWKVVNETTPAKKSEEDKE